MKLNEAMKKTGLTKKAIYYYEEEGLIKPDKEQEGGYRTYSDQDIKVLMTVQLLRKLDIPISDIKETLASGETLSHVATKQLSRLERELDRLQTNKTVLGQLTGCGDDLPAGKIKEMIAKLDENGKTTAGYMMKELDRILPGNLGKLFAIHYGQFLDQPLDTDEKEKAWHGLVEYLDACGEIQYPDSIKEMIDSMYKNLGEKELEGLSHKVKTATDSLLSRKSEVPPEVKAEILEKIQAYEQTGGYKDFLVFQEFVKNNLADIFEGVDQYMRVISSKFDQLQKLFHNAARSGTI